MSLAGLVVDAAAVARITRLVTEDEITRPVREKAHQTNPWLGYLVDCPYCISVWAGMAVASGVVPRPVRLGLALSQAVVIGYWLAQTLER